MHAHKDDTAGVPFLFLTPTRRPISRPSSRASTHSFRVAPGPARPDTPQSVVSAPGSPSLLGPIRRPHTPAMSPLGSGQSYMTISPSTSPVLSHAHTHIASHQSFLATSLPASPLSSPRLLNAKASEFRPTRPHSSASTNLPSLAGRRAETPSPDLWAHGSGALRGASKLAIASPLIPDSTLLPPGTPPRAHTPTSPLRIASHPDDVENNEDDDPYDPFAASRSKPRSFHPMQAVANPADFETGLSNSSNSNSSLSEESALWGAQGYMGPPYAEAFTEFDVSTDPHAHALMQHGFNHMGGGYYLDQQGVPLNDSDFDPETAAALTDGMTPFDVLSSVFGASLAPSELEEALAVNGYDFERAMQWLVDRASPTPPSQPQRGLQGQVYGGGVQVIPRSQAGFVMRGGRVSVGARGGRAMNGRAMPNGNRVCRYFLAGECMRADCRFR